MNENKYLLNKKCKFSISVEYICAFLVIVFCNCWYKALKPAPLYYFLIMSLIGIPYVLYKYRKIKISCTQILSLICFIYFLITSVLIHYKTDIGMASHSTVCFVFYFLSIFFMKYLTKDKVLNITKYLCIVSFLYISLETFIRIIFPKNAVGDCIELSMDSPYWAFKFNSFMFVDSNFVALVLLVMVFLSFYMYKYVTKDGFYKLMTIAFLILSILTVSRAAYIAIIISFAIFCGIDFCKKHLIISKRKKRITLKMLLFIFSSVISFFLFFYGMYLFLSDDSFMTKIQIIIDLWEYIQNVSLWNLLIGSGSNLGISIQYFGRFTHALIPSYIVWYGFVGTSLVMFLWFSIIRDTRFKSLIIMVPTLLIGIALTMSIIHVFYVALAIMTYFEKILPERESKERLIVKNN